MKQPIFPQLSELLLRQTFTSRLTTVAANGSTRLITLITFMSATSTLVSLTGQPSTKNAMSTSLISREDCKLTHPSHLAPGGYIEHSECLPLLASDDGSIREGDVMHQSTLLVVEASQKFGKSLVIQPLLKDMIIKAGFTDVVERTYKWPLGEWPSDPRLKKIGKWNRQHWLEGLDAWCMRILTQHCGVSEAFLEIQPIEKG